MPTDERKQRARLLTALRLVLGVLALIGLVLVGTIAWRVTGSTTLTRPTPTYVVRLEIVNATGNAGSAAALARRLDGFRDADLNIVVVDTTALDVRPVAQSLVIARTDEPAARLICERLGIVLPVEFRHLEYNRRQVSVTLVLGEDFRDLNDLTESEKET